MKENLTIIHWNMGAKLWGNKLLEIEAVILQYQPDIFAVSEAYLKLTLQAEQRDIQGYNMIFPKTIEVQNHARLVLLVKENLDVQILTQHMDSIVAAIWIKVASKGFVYREHQFIRQEIPSDSVAPQQQQAR